MSIIKYRWLKQSLLSLCLVLLTGGAVFAQETRSTILGTVSDPNGAAVVGATVNVTNNDTNANTQLVTNDKGHYEAPYLMAGNYTITVTATGFKKTVRQGFALTVNTRAEADIILEIGSANESVTVTADAPLLETTTGSGSTTLSNRQVMDLPVLNNSAILLARTVPGIQWTAAANYLGPHSNVGASAVNSAGGVGGTEFTMDGVPNAGPSRRVGALPYADTVSEIKIETAPFDASKGHSSGATISVVSKPGTNSYHGSATWQHWQQRWNATPTTLNAAYWGPIIAAEAAGDTAKAQQLRDKERQETGRSNNWAGVIGGPVRVPWLFNGKDRLFFFFSHNGLKEVKTEEPVAVRRTVPTLKQRQGDFSELLAIDPERYQIYDPRTARLVNGRVVRDPFPNNQNVPILNPLYDEYLKLIPLPNNVPGQVGADGQFNYLASATPFNWDFKDYSNRIDFVISQKQRMFGKWGYQNFIEDRGDWTYETARGLHQNGLNRNNIAVIVDHLYTFNPTTILNTSVSWNRYRDGNTQNAVQRGFGPDSVGWPDYLTDRAGDAKHLPVLDFITDTGAGNFSSYSDFSRSFTTPTRFSIGTIRGELTKILNSHSLRFGYDLRNHYRQFNNPGNTSGSIQPRNTYVRQADNTSNAGVLGLEWAAWMLGVPGGSITVAQNDSYYLTNKYYGFYVQDDWRFSPKLTINVGLRFEREGGFRERYNRAVVGFDPNAELPIAAAAQAAYAAIALPELPASQFTVRGGSVYLDQNGGVSHLSENMFMPKIGLAYQWNEKTVIRGGYGLFYDTNNVLNNDLNQLGYSRGTSSPVSNDNGLTFTLNNIPAADCFANQSNCIFDDPFPVRDDGTRFNTPVGDALGLMAGVGRNIAYIPNDWKHARQQRWRFSVQRQLSQNMVFEFAYLGSYTDRISLGGKRLDPLPEQYWASGLVRNSALASDLNRAINPNPFRVTNFAFLENSDPLLWQDISSNSFFTSTTRRKHELLRPNGHLSGSTTRFSSIGESKYHDLEFTLNKRLSQGMSYQVSYIRTWNQDRNVLENEFDEKPTWRVGNNSRPHHLMFNALWEVPVGKGRRFLSNAKVVNHLLGGWQVSAIYHIQSGPAYDLGNYFFYGDDLRAITKSRGERTPDEWFNWQLFPGASRDYAACTTAAPNACDAWMARVSNLAPANLLPANLTFNKAEVGGSKRLATPDDFRPDSFHVRVSPTRVDWLRTDYMNQVDMNVAKSFSVTEGLKLQFRADFINALNKVHYQGPDTNINSANFGKITAQANIPRWMQFQLRVTF